MRILSWNVNGLGARVEAIKRLSQELCPDIMCFQKRQAIGTWSIVDISGYMGIRGQVSTSRLLFGGVSTYFRTHSDFETAFSMPIDGWLGETGNIQVFYFDDFFIVNAYVLYSNPTDSEWIHIRQHWDIKFHEKLCNLAKQKPLIVCGDFNIVSQDIDAWDGIYHTHRDHVFYLGFLIKAPRLKFGISINDA